jgi:hypothetical protein
MPEEKPPICRPGMRENSADYEKCALQARADAIAAVRQCNLPLEPRRAATGVMDAIQRWWDEGKEKPTNVCENEELRAKPRIYHVRNFTHDETIDILYTGRKQGELAARQGETRPRVRP